ncbi:DUF3251 domain-containing protein [Citrobacter youngae]|uniref:Uncharacterized protein n=1 Tax=Citrobacter youngae ATCC 29220 TaxID=500640 RepID=D4BIM9_9ENTR|nr:DUF3251 domain-containing protein [Citrobacter youngae]EFE06273.1 hypothetical protein CIT292_10396 [Citrobacter youngae ATCC 29220]
MYTNGKCIPPLILGFTFLLSGCDYLADKHLIEELKKQQKEQQEKINALEKQQVAIVGATQKVANVIARIERKQRLFEYTELDPSQTRYFIINNGNIGLAGRILSIEPIADGSVIHLDLVNLVSVPVSNIGFHMTWGGKKPADAKDLPRWQQLLFSTQMDSTLQLLPGKWTNVDLTLKGVSPNNLKYLRVGMNMKDILFEDPRPTKEKKKETKK